MANSQSLIDPLHEGAGMNVSELVKHYIQNELPRLAYSTQCAYQSNLKSWIVPMWGNHQLREVKAVQVEAWLASLTLKNGIKSKIRNIMCSLFSHACRWEMTERNPIINVRQATQRAKTPAVLSNVEITKRRPANPYDNASCESFIKTLKREEIYANQHDDLEHLRTNIEEFIDRYYNRQRLHSALGYRSPEEFERQSECRSGAVDSRSATMEFFENKMRASTEMLGKGTQSPSPSPDPISS
jgi:hypothetical protein